jgi:hypothetical protein
VFGVGYRHVSQCVYLFGIHCHHTRRRWDIELSLPRAVVFVDISTRPQFPPFLHMVVILFSRSLCNRGSVPQDTTRLANFFPKEINAPKTFRPNATRSDATGLNDSLLAAARPAPRHVEEREELNQPAVFRFPTRVLVGALFACTMSIVLTLRTYLVIPQITSYLSNVDFPVRYFCFIFSLSVQVYLNIV